MSREHRGTASEALVEKALEIIGGQGRKDLPKIAAVVHAYPNSFLDRQGIDFLVTLGDGKKIPLQVKSSSRGKRKFERSHRNHRQFIPVVVATIGEEIGLVINRVIKCIKLVLSKVRYQFNMRVDVMRRISRKRRTKDWCVRHFAPAMCH